MNELTEAIAKATQAAEMLSSDISEAWLIAQELSPANRSTADKALIGYLCELLGTARKMEAKLMELR